LTDELETRARGWMHQVEERGGAVAAIESGFVQNAIGENAYLLEMQRESGDRVIVGVNRYAAEDEVEIPAQTIDAAATRRQEDRVRAYKAAQDVSKVSNALDGVTAAVQAESEPLLAPMREALIAGATLGQIAGRLRQEFGEYRAPA
jgi:methylmalonyl-CoA mutase N-terminal domain/subunit